MSSPLFQRFALPVFESPEYNSKPWEEQKELSKNIITQYESAGGTVDDYLADADEYFSAKPVALPKPTTSQGKASIHKFIRSVPGFLELPESSRNNIARDFDSDRASFQEAFSRELEKMDQEVPPTGAMGVEFKDKPSLLRDAITPVKEGVRAMVRAPLQMPGQLTEVLGKLSKATTGYGDLAITSGNEAARFFDDPFSIPGKAVEAFGDIGKETVGYGDAVRSLGQKLQNILPPEDITDPTLGETSRFLTSLAEPLGSGVGSSLGMLKSGAAIGRAVTPSLKSGIQALPGGQKAIDALRPLLEKITPAGSTPTDVAAQLAGSYPVSALLQTGEGIDALEAHPETKKTNPLWALLPGMATAMVDTPLAMALTGKAKLPNPVQKVMDGFGVPGKTALMMGSEGLEEGGQKLGTEMTPYMAMGRLPTSQEFLKLLEEKVAPEAMGGMLSGPVLGAGHLFEKEQNQQKSDGEQVPPSASTPTPPILTPELFAQMKSSFGNPTDGTTFDLGKWKEAMQEVPVQEPQEENIISEAVRQSQTLEEAQAKIKNAYSGIYGANTQQPPSPIVDQSPQPEQGVGIIQETREIKDLKSELKELAEAWKSLKVAGQGVTDPAGKEQIQNMLQALSAKGKPIKAQIESRGQIEARIKSIQEEQKQLEVAMAAAQNNAIARRTIKKRIADNQRMIEGLSSGQINVTERQADLLSKDPMIGQPAEATPTLKALALLDQMDLKAQDRKPKIEPPKPLSVADFPLLSAIRGMGGIRKSTGENGGEYDASIKALEEAGFKATPDIFRAINGTGKLAPDRMANQLFDAGLIPENSPETMWNALRSEVLGLARSRKEAKSEKNRLAEEELRQQDWENNQSEPVTAGTLSRGDQFTIQGEKYRVIDEGDSALKLKDGIEFWMPYDATMPDGTIRIDRGSLAKETSKPGPASVDKTPVTEPTFEDMATMDALDEQWGELGQKPSPNEPKTNAQKAVEYFSMLDGQEVPKPILSKQKTFEDLEKGIQPSFDDLQSTPPSQTQKILPDQVQNPEISGISKSVGVIPAERALPFVPQVDVELEEMVSSGAFDRQTAQKTREVGAAPVNESLGVDDSVSSNLSKKELERMVDAKEALDVEGKLASVVTTDFEILNLAGMNSVYGDQGSNRMISRILNRIRERVNTELAEDYPDSKYYFNLWHMGGPAFRMNLVADSPVAKFMDSVMDNVQRDISELQGQIAAPDIKTGQPVKLADVKHSKDLTKSGTGVMFALLPVDTKEEIGSVFADNKANLQKQGGQDDLVKRWKAGANPDEIVRLTQLVGKTIRGGVESIERIDGRRVGGTGQENRQGPGKATERVEPNPRSRRVSPPKIDDVAKALGLSDDQVKALWDRGVFRIDSSYGLLDSRNQKAAKAMFTNISEMARIAGKPMSLVMIDHAGISASNKIFAEELGESQGKKVTEAIVRKSLEMVDIVLEEAGTTIQKMRVGGDENLGFSTLTPKDATKAMNRAAKRIKERFAEHGFDALPNLKPEKTPYQETWGPGIYFSVIPIDGKTTFEEAMDKAGIGVELAKEAVIEEAKAFIEKRQQEQEKALAASKGKIEKLGGPDLISRKKVLTFLEKVFPVTEEEVQLWWDGGDLGEKKNRIAQAAVDYQADIEHALMEGAGAEAVDLLARALTDIKIPSRRPRFSRQERETSAKGKDDDNAVHSLSKRTENQFRRPGNRGGTEGDAGSSRTRERGVEGSDQERLGRLEVSLSVEERDKGYLGSLKAIETPTVSQALIRDAFQDLFGKRVIFFDDNSPVAKKRGGRSVMNGAVLTDDSDTIYIATSAAHPGMVVAGHELLHTIRMDDADLYDQLLEAITPQIKDTTRFKETMTRRGQTNLSESQIVEELLGDFLGDRMGTRDFWNNLSQKNPTLFERVAGAFRRFCDLIRGWFSRQPNYQSDQYFRDIQAASEVAERVVAEYAQRKRNARSQTGVGKFLNAMEDRFPGEKETETEAARSRFSYAGEKSLKNLPAKEEKIKKNNLEVAKKMDVSNMDTEKIRLATGWFKGPYDGKWRYEVDDSSASLTETFQNLKNNKIVKLEKVLSHPKLFKAYPWMREVLFVSDGEMSPGSALFSPGLGKHGQITMSDKFPIGKNGNLFSDEKITLLHEIQHAIQSNEGFARGGSLAHAAMEKNAARKEYLLWGDAFSLKTWAEENNLGIREAVKPLENYFGDELLDPEGAINLAESFSRETLAERAETAKSKMSGDDIDLYRRHAGEIESRDVEDRAGLNEKERKEYEPFSSADVSPEDAIVRFGSNDSAKIGDIQANAPNIRFSRKDSAKIEDVQNKTPEEAQKEYLGEPLKVPEVTMQDIVETAKGKKTREITEAIPAMTPKDKSFLEKLGGMLGTLGQGFVSLVGPLASEVSEARAKELGVEKNKLDLHALKQWLESLRGKVMGEIEEALMRAHINAESDKMVKWIEESTSPGDFRDFILDKYRRIVYPWHAFGAIQRKLFLIAERVYWDGAKIAPSPGFRVEKVEKKTKSDGSVYLEKSYQYQQDVSPDLVMENFQALPQWAQEAITARAQHNETFRKELVEKKIPERIQKNEVQTRIVEAQIAEAEQRLVDLESMPDADKSEGVIEAIKKQSNKLKSLRRDWGKLQTQLRLDRDNRGHYGYVHHYGYPTEIMGEATEGTPPVIKPGTAEWYDAVPPSWKYRQGTRGYRDVSLVEADLMQRRGETRAEFENKLLLEIEDTYGVNAEDYRENKEEWDARAGNKGWAAIDSLDKKDAQGNPLKLMLPGDVYRTYFNVRHPEGNTTLGAEAAKVFEALDSLTGPMNEALLWHPTKFFRDILSGPIHVMEFIRDYGTRNMNDPGKVAAMIPAAWDALKKAYSPIAPDVWRKYSPGTLREFSESLYFQKDREPGVIVRGLDRLSRAVSEFPIGSVLAQVFRTVNLAGAGDIPLRRFFTILGENLADQEKLTGAEREKFIQNMVSQYGFDTKNLTPGLAFFRGLDESRASKIMGTASRAIAPFFGYPFLAAKSMLIDPFYRGLPDVAQGGRKAMLEGLTPEAQKQLLSGSSEILRPVLWGLLAMAAHGWDDDDETVAGNLQGLENLNPLARTIGRIRVGANEKGESWLSTKGYGIAGLADAMVEALFSDKDKSVSDLAAEVISVSPNLQVFLHGIGFPSPYSKRTPFKNILAQYLTTIILPQVIRAGPDMAKYLSLAMDDKTIPNREKMSLVQTILSQFGVPAKVQESLGTGPVPRRQTKDNKMIELDPTIEIIKLLGPNIRHIPYTLSASEAGEAMTTLDIMKEKSAKAHKYLSAQWGQGLSSQKAAEKIGLSRAMEFRQALEQIDMDIADRERRLPKAIMNLPEPYRQAADIKSKKRRESFLDYLDKE
jgi:hypothetical protein